MLKKRLAESKRSIKFSCDYEDISMIYGNDVQKECERLRKNMDTDIDQLNYLVWCLKNRDAVKEKFSF